MAYDVRQHRFANNSWGKLSVAALAGDLTLTVTVGAATTWPTIAPGEIFKIVVVNPASGAREIMNCTAFSGVVMTVERGKEGTSAVGFPIGALVQHCITAETLEWFEALLQG